MNATRPTVLVNGTWTDGDSGYDVTDPATGELVGQVGWGGPADAVRAADAAAAAFDGWAATPARRRGDLLRDAADLLDSRRDELAVLLAREAGKRLPEAAGELAFSAEYFRWFAEQARRPTGMDLPAEAPGRAHRVLRHPAGVVASLTPWNFPCSIQARKLAPALAAGCTVVARVSEKAPLAVTEMLRCLTDAGLPAGVVNLVHGPAPEQVAALLDHEAVRVVSFTGSTHVGTQIMAAAARRVVRPVLELGGDAAFVVLDDADVPAAVEGALLAKFRNTGQSCIAANRFLVHRSVHDEFVSRFVSAVDAMTVGNGLSDPLPDLGPVIDDDRARALSSLVDEAVDAGATVLTAPRDLPPTGSWTAPALLGDVPTGTRLSCEEVFGPVAAITAFDDDEQALRLADVGDMGLAGYVWSRDTGRGERFAARMPAGIVGVNDPLPSVVFAPMGGVRRSGLGREGGHEGLDEFTEAQYLAVRG